MLSLICSLLLELIVVMNICLVAAIVVVSSELVLDLVYNAFHINYVVVASVCIVYVIAFLGCVCAYGVVGVVSNNVVVYVYLKSLC